MSGWKVLLAKKLSPQRFCNVV